MAVGGGGDRALTTKLTPRCSGAFHFFRLSVSCSFVILSNVHSIYNKINAQDRQILLPRCVDEAFFFSIRFYEKTYYFPPLINRYFCIMSVIFFFFFLMGSVLFKGNHFVDN